jgi:hypothetical protein
MSPQPERSSWWLCAAGLVLAFVCMAALAIGGNL